MKPALLFLLSPILAFAQQPGPLPQPQEVMDLARSEPMTYVTRAKIPNASDQEWQCVWKNSKVWLVSTYCNSRGNPGALEITFFVPGSGAVTIHDEGTSKWIQVRRPLAGVSDIPTSGSTQNFLSLASEHFARSPTLSDTCSVWLDSNNRPQGQCAGNLSGSSWASGAGNALSRLSSAPAWSAIDKYVSKRPIPTGTHSIGGAPEPAN